MYFVAPRLLGRHFVERLFLSMEEMFSCIRFAKLKAQSCVLLYWRLLSSHAIMYRYDVTEIYIYQSLSVKIIKFLELDNEKNLLFNLILCLTISVSVG